MERDKEEDEGEKERGGGGSHCLIVRGSTRWLRDRVSGDDGGNNAWTTDEKANKKGYLEARNLLSGLRDNAT